MMGRESGGAPIGLAVGSSGWETTGSGLVGPFQAGVSRMARGWWLAGDVVGTCPAGQAAGLPIGAGKNAGEVE